MSIRSTIENFYSAVRKASAQLETSCKNIDDRQENISSIINGINSRQESSQESNNDIEKLCQSQAQQFNKAIEQWKKSVSRYLTSKEFVNKFERSLLLIVFADVKAGKSTLGNFVSGYSFKNTPFGDLYTNPEYYVYDHTDKTLGSCIEKPIPEGHFVENVIQATSSIQYFTLLNGLTWVDTPGVHSLTSEYEQLTKDYIKYADLILYLTPSNNAFKMDECDEISRLVESGKPMLLAVTKSDIQKVTGYDETSGKVLYELSPKDDETRAAHEELGKKQCAALCKGNFASQHRFISISAFIAKTAMERNDDEFFRQSNIPDFLELIGQVISDKSVELKMKRPRDEVNSVINELLHGCQGSFIGTDALLDNLSHTLEKISEAENRLSLLKSSILTSARSEISNEIYSMLFGEKNSGNIADKSAAADKSEKIINNVLSREISEAAARELNDFQQIQLSSAELIIDADYQHRTKTIEYEYLDGRNRTRDPRGLIEHIQHFFGKEFTEYSVRTKKRTREIDIGDNFSEYAQRVIELSLDSIEKTVSDEITKLSRETYGRMRTSIEEMYSDIKTAADSLEKLKY